MAALLQSDLCCPLSPRAVWPRLLEVVRLEWPLRISPNTSVIMKFNNMLSYVGLIFSSIPDSDKRASHVEEQLFRVLTRWVRRSEPFGIQAIVRMRCESSKAISSRCMDTSTTSLCIMYLVLASYADEIVCAGD